VATKISDKLINNNSWSVLLCPRWVLAEWPCLICSLTACFRFAHEGAFRPGGESGRRADSAGSGHGANGTNQLWAGPV
jgi:hypothetical protein